MITSCLLGDADYLVKLAEHGHDRRLGSRGLYAQPDVRPAVEFNLQLSLGLAGFAQSAFDRE